MIGVFQHTAARRRLPPVGESFRTITGFNTQPRGGGCTLSTCANFKGRGFNTQPHGGGCEVRHKGGYARLVSTHSRAEAAAKKNKTCDTVKHVSTHSRAKAAANCDIVHKIRFMVFQHTAARRRLPCEISLKSTRFTGVSTHSRAKAAA